MKYLTHSGAETERLGEAFSDELKRRALTDGIILIKGDVGAGKTTFIRGVCRFFGYFRVKSPSYTIVNEYQGGDLDIYHFDFYRLNDPSETDSIGVDDYFVKSGLKLCEWPEQIEQIETDVLAIVSIERGAGESDRQIEIIIAGEE